MDPFDWYWWQRGYLITCGYLRAFHWCVLDNLTHELRYQRLMLRRRTGWTWLFRGIISDGWICTRHRAAVDAAAERKWGDDSLDPLYWGYGH